MSGLSVALPLGQLKLQSGVDVMSGTVTNTIAFQLIMTHLALITQPVCLPVTFAPVTDAPAGFLQLESLKGTCS